MRDNLKQISKELKEFIVARYKNVHIKRTVHKWYIEESAEVIRAITQYEEQNMKREDDKSVR